jgi:iron complex transport system ATP-binding protein
MRIEVENLRFAYADNDVLHDVSLQVAEKQIVCLVGPNGSGKSTLIKCIDALLMPRSGRVLFDGKDSRAMARMDIARLLGYVPQSASNSFSASVFDTILMGRRPYSSWHTGEQDIEIVVDILTRMELEDIALREFNHLSGGQQQRVLIARALAQEPKALLLDEPTSSLDIAHQLEVMDVIHGLAHDQRVSVLMIAHDLNLAARYSDRIVMLNEGRVFAEGDPEQVFTVPNLAQVYGIETLVQRQSGSISIYPTGLRREKERAHAD